MPTTDENAELVARIEALLAAAKPTDLSTRQWLLLSRVNSSFFTDLRKGVVPGIDKLARLARRAGLSLSELLDGASTAPRTLPSAEDLETMLAEAQNEVLAGASIGDYPQYVAPALLTRLERFAADQLGVTDRERESAPGTTVPRRRSTKPSAQVE